MKKFVFLFSLLCCTLASKAQDSLQITRDTIYIQPQDTTLIQSYAKRYNPRKALLYAAIMPGLGQAYNKKYWKIPLVYGGAYWIAVYIDKYNGIYKKYKVQYYYNIEHNLSAATAVHPVSKISTANLSRIVERARRERDFSIILMGGMYLLQIIDAHVDAHLKEFDLNPNLHARIRPSVTNDIVLGRQSGLSLTLRF